MMYITCLFTIGSLRVLLNHLIPEQTNDTNMAYWITLVILGIGFLAAPSEDEKK